MRLTHNRMWMVRSVKKLIKIKKLHKHLKASSLLRQKLLETRIFKILQQMGRDGNPRFSIM